MTEVHQSIKFLEVKRKQSSVARENRRREALSPKGKFRDLVIIRVSEVVIPKANGNVGGQEYRKQGKIDEVPIS